MIRVLRELAEDWGRYLPRLRERALLRQGAAGSADGGDDLGALGQRAVERLHPRSMELRVASVIEETASTRTYRCVRIDGELPPFRAGQYLSVKLRIGSVHTTRAYSISSAPGEPHVDLTVKLNPAGFASPHVFATIHEGSRLVTSGPEGSFGLEPLIDRGDAVMLAGGSGITPFMSILRDAERARWPRRMVLLYGSRRQDDVIFGSRLAELDARAERFRYRLVISEPDAGYQGERGFIDAALIAREVGAVAGKTFLVCGPAAMGEHCERALRELGVPPHKIRREIFGSAVELARSSDWPAGASLDQPVTIEVVGHGTIAGQVGESLLVSLERAGLQVPSGCRTGECADCRLSVEQGPVHLLRHRGVREADVQLGNVHSCISYPLGDLRVRLRGRQTPRG